jgi:hypothetical protein
MSLEQVTNADQPATDDEAMLVRVQREDFSIDEELRRVRRRSKRIGGIAMFLGYGPRPFEGEGCGRHHLRALRRHGAEETARDS